MLWRDLGGRTKEKHQELQNLDPTSSPHLEEILFGGRTDLDLLSCFPKNGQESLEGRVGIKLLRFATMEERERERAKGFKRLENHWGRKLPLNRFTRNLPVGLRFPQGR